MAAAFGSRARLQSDDKASGAILSQTIADKAVGTVRLPEGTREEPLPAELRSRAVLDAAQATELARLGVDIEALYGQPMDIEWARADGHLYLLQARPVTTAGAFEKEEFRKGEIARLQAMAVPTGTVWARYNLAEMLVYGRNQLQLNGEKKGMKFLQNRFNRMHTEGTPIEAAKLLTPAERSNKSVLITALEKRLLQSKLKPKQEATLQDYLAHRGSLEDHDILETIRLMMSTPEYQLT
jgi:hypothetical protein